MIDVETHRPPIDDVIADIYEAWLREGHAAAPRPVASGAPELRYWPVRFCPFCGAALPPPPASIRRRRS